MSDLININGKNYKKHQALMVDGGGNSPMFYHNIHDKLFLSRGFVEQGKHICIISDEEPKDGDLCYHTEFKMIGKFKKHPTWEAVLWIEEKSIAVSKVFCKKVMYLTDDSLRVVKYTEGGYFINGGTPFPLPKPSKEFISVYAELYNSSKQKVIDVLVEYTDKGCKSTDNKGRRIWIENWQPVISKDDTVSITLP